MFLRSEHDLIFILGSVWSDITPELNKFSLSLSLHARIDKLLSLIDGLPKHLALGGLESANRTTVADFEFDSRGIQLPQFCRFTRLHYG